MLRDRTDGGYPSHPLTTPVATPLSILDATATRFSTAGAIWLFDKPTDESTICLLDCEDDLFAGLKSSLITTLNEFPHSAGQVQWGLV